MLIQKQKRDSVKNSKRKILRKIREKLKPEEKQVVFHTIKIMVTDYTPKSSFTQQLKATLIRNLRLKWRDSRKTTAEIFLPLYTLGTLIVLKILIPNPNFPAILEPRGDGKLFQHFNQLENHTVAVLPHVNSTRHQTAQVTLILF